MPDTSKFWRDVDNMSDIEYLYGNYSGGKSALDKKIKNAEEMLNKQRQSAEDNLERIFDQENLVRLKGMNVKDMSFNDVELYNFIKKKYSNTNKSYDGSDLPQAEGAVPDNTDTLKQMMGALNTIKQSLEGRGYQVPQLKPINSLSDVLQNFRSIRDSLKGQIQQPEDEEEYDQPIKWSREELLATKSEIEKMLRKLDGR